MLHVGNIKILSVLVNARSVAVFSSPLSDSSLLLRTGRGSVVFYESVIVGNERASVAQRHVFDCDDTHESAPADESSRVHWHVTKLVRAVEIRDSRDQATAHFQVWAR